MKAVLTAKAPWVIIWTSIFWAMVSTQVRENMFFLYGGPLDVNLTAAQSNGTEFRWTVASHSHDNETLIVTCVRQPSGDFSTLLPTTAQYVVGRNTCSISFKPRFEYAGVYTFVQAKPTYILLNKTELFALRVHPFVWSAMPAGADASMSCQASGLPPSASLQWERAGHPSANTTLLYNNTAWIILHNIGTHSRGLYFCTVREEGELLYAVVNSLSVTGSKNSSYILYRESSGNSAVSLVCGGEDGYDTGLWYWTRQPENSLTLLASAQRNNHSSLVINATHQRITSPGYQDEFNLQISPVLFEDSGLYGCYFTIENQNTIELTTVRAGVAAPVGPSPNGPLVLTCELSSVTDLVTLAWLKVKGRQRVLVQQRVLRHPNRMLHLTLHSLHREELSWECVVFEKGMFLARAPLTLTAQYLQHKRGVSIALLVRLSVVGAASVVTAALVWFYCKRLQNHGNVRMQANAMGSSFAETQQL